MDKTNKSIDKYKYLLYINSDLGKFPMLETTAIWKYERRDLMKDYYGWLKEQELHKKKKEKESSLKREDREKKKQKQKQKKKKKNKETRCSIEHLVLLRFFI